LRRIGDFRAQSIGIIRQNAIDRVPIRARDKNTLRLNTAELHSAQATEYPGSQLATVTISSRQIQ
jgi:hypothetical protein